MKQVVFSRGSAARAVDTPVPALKPGTILVRTHFSAVSVGTERAAGVGGTNVLRKVLEKPQQIGQVISVALNEGVAAAAQRVSAALGAWMPSGYSNSGTVVAVAEDVSEFHVGDRVACAGGGYAVHAEYCVVPKRLAVRVPDSVPLDDAAFATIGAVAMHGFRVGAVNLGESVAVIGLGIVGQLLCQIAAAAGARVFALDIDPKRVELAARLSEGVAITIQDGKEVGALQALTQGRGVDAVYLSAATASNEPARLAMNIARDRGTVVVVGDVGLDIDRQLMYDKELELRISRSYGPGRYDRNYEERGHDYPYSHVRWTQQRNMESFIDLLERKALRVGELVTHRAPVETAAEALSLLSGDSGERPLGALFTYDVSSQTSAQRSIAVSASRASARIATPRIALIGPGAFATSVLLPALAKHGVSPVVIAGSGGLAATDVARRLEAESASTDIDAVLSDPKIDAVIIATRHGSHAQLVVRALEAGKHVYVEKPLGTSIEQLEDICRAYNQAGREVMVGFNRRFAPFSVRARESLSQAAPPVMMYRVNAGALDDRHWSLAGDEGGGRIIGEGCHFIDLMQFMTGAPVTSVYAQAMRTSSGLEQDVSMTLNFENGALGTLVYTSQGNAGYRKEYLELFAGGRVACIDDFSLLTLTGGRKPTRAKARQDKGFVAEMGAWLDHLRGKAPCPIPFEQSLATSLATLAAVESVRTGLAVAVPKVQV